VKKVLRERQEADHQLLEMDRDENKLDAFLNVHKNSLKVNGAGFRLLKLDVSFENRMLSSAYGSLYKTRFKVDCQT
jgi:hypothetical protein